MNKKKYKNQSLNALTESDFELKSRTTTKLKAIIVGTSKYIGEVNITYTCNNFLVMCMLGTSGPINSLTSNNETVYKS